MDDKVFPLQILIILHLINLLSDENRKMLTYHLSKPKISCSLIDIDLIPDGFFIKIDEPTKRSIYFNGYVKNIYYDENIATLTINNRGSAVRLSRLYSMDCKISDDHCGYILGNKTALDMIDKIREFVIAVKDIIKCDHAPALVHINNFRKLFEG
jgi:hypothetical protein